MLLPVDGANQTHLAQVSVLAHSPRFHDRLENGGWTIKRELSRLTDITGNYDGGSAAFERNQHVRVSQLCLVKLSQFGLKRRKGFAGCGNFSNQGQAHLAIRPDLLRLIEFIRTREGKLDYVAWRKHDWRIERRLIRKRPARRA